MTGETDRQPSGWADIARHLEEQGPAPGLVYASAGRRLGAWLIDGFIVGIVASLLSLLWWLPILSDPSWPYRAAYDPEQVYALYQSPVWVLVAVASLLFSGLYFVLGWRLWRGSPGQRALGVYVGNAADGGRLSWGRAVVRWLAITLAPVTVIVSLIPWPGGFIGSALVAVVVSIWQIVLLVTVATNPKRQGLHDRWADSLVVRRANG